ncbi:MAG: hypothetical protein IJ083_08885 [Clostridia bacterium]|nr:hypothetical protein [Clostridia bacterium]
MQTAELMDTQQLQEKTGPRRIWDQALKAVRGESTQQLVESFTQEMTLVAEGLCEDQSRIRTLQESITERQDRLEEKLEGDFEVLDRTQRENVKESDRQIRELRDRVAVLEKQVDTLRQEAEDAKSVKAKGRKLLSMDGGVLHQAIILASILGGSWITVTVLNLIREVIAG